MTTGPAWAVAPVMFAGDQLLYLYAAKAVCSLQHHWCDVNIEIKINFVAQAAVEP